jgi:hypothetical protein
MFPRRVAVTFVCILTFVACAAEVSGDDPPDGGGSSNPPTDPPSGGDACGDGVDNDGNGVVDDGCACSPGQSQSCWPFAPANDGVGACIRGTQVCLGDGEFGNWGPCDGAVGPAPDDCGDGIDSDCDGVDPICGDDPPPPPGTVEVPLFFIGDCVFAACPPEAPYPVGCNVLFSPGDDRGCVASTPTDSAVYFQAGDECDQGIVGGRLYCAATPGAPLDASSCPINKPVPIYATSPSGCPPVH